MTLCIVSICAWYRSAVDAGTPDPVRQTGQRISGRLIVRGVIDHVAALCSSYKSRGVPCQSFTTPEPTLRTPKALLNAAYGGVGKRQGETVRVADIPAGWRHPANNLLQRDDQSHPLEPPKEPS